MSVRHLNCGTMRPLGALGGRLTPTSLVAHCLLVERAEGLLLVDTGFGTADLADPARLGRPFRAVVRPTLDPAETARAQVLALGHQVEDVTDVVLTHLDLDHAGGIADFPHARVHVLADELEAALRPSLRVRARYVAAQWSHGPRWERHRVPGEAAGDSWHGFGAVSVLETGGDEPVLLVPLPGHTRGHCGVAVPRPGGGWLLHAGDAYFSAGDLTRPVTTPPGLRAFQRLMAVDDRQRRDNLGRLRELVATSTPDVTVFSAHDPVELADLQA